MSGLFRNLITVISALFSRSRPDVRSKVESYFWITPWDTGFNILKSDKYLQLAESAQLDFLIKTKLISKLRKQGVSFVNASQIIKFLSPIRLFQRVRLVTIIAYADDKCAYFSHGFFIGDKRHGIVLVKMKFKKGFITVPPFEIISGHFTEKLPCLEPWNNALAVM